jgi:hypothetical protein
LAVLVFKNPDLSLKVRESLLLISFLLQRSWFNVVEPSTCSDSEKEKYKTSILNLITASRSSILEELYIAHPHLKPALIVDEEGFYDYPSSDDELKLRPPNDESVFTADATVASQICEAMLMVNVTLINSLHLVGACLSEDQRKEYQLKIADVMEITLFDVLPTIWEKYPDLMPLEFRDGEP